MNSQELQKLFDFLNELDKKIDNLSKRITTNSRPTRSEQIDKLAEAFAKAQAEYPAIGFNRQGHFKNKYADLHALLYEIRPILGKHGLSFFCEPQITDDERNIVYAQLIHSSGQWISATSRITLDAQNKNYNHAYASSLTYMKRNLAKALLNLTDADDPDDDDSVYAYPDPHVVSQKVHTKSPEILRSTSDPSYDTITKEQWEHLSNLLKDHPEICQEILAKMKLKSLRDFPKDQFEAAVRKINGLIYEYKNIKPN